jgi:hypothetical protein
LSRVTLNTTITLTTKVYKNKYASTLYVIIPTNMACDSACPLKEGTTAKVTIEGNAVVFRSA